VGHPASHSRRSEGPEVADILRDHAYGLSLTHEQVRVVHAIASCRTAALGGHVERCKVCGYERNAYNSCRNRHCPKCQILKQEVWAERQEGRLLPVPYFHVVFTRRPK
jgi:predicted Zn-ribbon and HTH transcriptional regulator